LSSGNEEPFGGKIPLNGFYLLELGQMDSQRDLRGIPSNKKGLKHGIFTVNSVGCFMIYSTTLYKIS
jgi:hypothetical protein